VTRIQVLPDAVARKIAAGEVIERPVSVVKELVENSLDAGARAITVELEQGGRARIAVADDGEGMSRDDAELAFRPHATSKIRSEEDLLCIATLGFRGEALPSIAAVADVEVTTCRRGETVGTRLRLCGGERLALEDAGAPAGCRIEVRDLFFSTPARRKFLKAPTTEAGHVAQLLARLALSHPAIAFTLSQEGRETLALPPSDLRTRIRHLLGREVDEALLEAVEAGDGAVRVTGFVTHPHFSQAHQRGLHFFVNRRLVRDRVLQHAVQSAYATLVPQGRYPAVVLDLDLSPQDVDVNVHPTKLEVRFRDGRAVHEAIGRTVRETLRRAGARLPMAAEPIVAEATAGYAPAAPAAQSAFDLQGRSARLHLVPSPAPEPEAAPRPGSLASMRVVGQVFEGYLVCEGDGEVLLIDQHAAHERVAFERLRAERARGEIERQPLLVPQPVEVAPGEADLIAGAAADLAVLGFEVEPFGDRTVLVRTVPALLRPSDVAVLVKALASDLSELERSRALEQRTDRILATIACHSVVRVGQRLSEAEIRGLLEAMDSIDLGSNCPHGRPVASRLTRAELERRFGR
jgi:DNA mismatch repair protein MutL